MSDDRQLSGQAHRAVCLRASRQGVLWLFATGRDAPRPPGCGDESGRSGRIARQSSGTAQGRPYRAVFDSHQRSMANLLCMAGRITRPDRSSDCRLSLGIANMPRTPIHPGEHLAEELRELGITAAELSRQIDVPVNRVTGIINGQRGITADTALRLGHWFGTSPQFWMNLQQQYELRLAEQEVGAQVASLPRRASAQPTRKIGKTA